MYKMLVIGLSAGGIPLVKRILRALPQNYPLAIAIVAHLSREHESHLAEMLNELTYLPVSMARDKEVISPGRVYIAPPDYHLLVEQNPHPQSHFSLSVDGLMKSVRPSIDVLFESAAEVFESGLIGVLLSGANTDGVEGMACVKRLGGLSVVLDPQECDFATMPHAVIKHVDVDYIASMDEIVSLLLSVYEPS